ncbi:MAG: tetratricopeptide repeat protein [Cyclobacteriaceae bacterium]|nr:tetratricopeptide repeat protein [Cyclobacteriaceae bacterium]
MPLLPGYEYDIFISYRHNDNRNGWVMDFVNALQEELAATIKEPLSIYFDKNPHDGLLETHNVDKSLEGKLKCLIFIPIISQTYCDPKSFAWQHEFVAFNELSKNDQFGRDIKLSNGNVASRILPIKIHDLDTEDRAIIENEISGALRAIEFIYKEAGVNRPLKSSDNRNDNQNKTDYKNQVNKVANAVKEILSGIKKPSAKHPVPLLDSTTTPKIEKSIVVLPFVNMSNDPEQEYFSEGISEEIINTLVQIPTLKVAGRTSSFSFKNRNEDLRSIGEKLGVSNILEGSVRKSGNRIRITAQLIEASSGFHLWSQKYDRELHDVFAIQDEIAKAIVDQLQITLSGQLVEPKERTQTQNVEAYQLYLKGMAFYYKRGLDMFEGLRCFEAALKLDANYPLALAGVADSFTMLCLHSYLPPETAWPKALEASRRALELGPDLAETHNAVAIIALFNERNWEKAEKEFKKALELNPTYLQARSWFGLFYWQSVRGDNDEALRQAKLALENDPLSSYAYIILAVVSSLANLHEEAISAGLKAVECDPNSFSAWHFLGVGYHWSGNLTEAIRPYKRALEISGRHIWTLTSLVVAYAKANQMQEAKIIYNELIVKSKLSYVSPSCLSITAAVLGKNEEALLFAHDAYRRHDPYQIVTAKYWSESKSLRAIPGFTEILQMLAYP